MKRINARLFPSLPPNARFFIEIGICILIAFGLFQSFSFIKSQNKSKENLTELASSLDELQEIYDLIEKEKLGSIQEEELEMEKIKLRVELIMFHEMWLDGLAKNQPMPWKELNELRQKIDLMKDEELNRLERLKEIPLFREKSASLSEIHKQMELDRRAFDWEDVDDDGESGFEDDWGDAFWGDPFTEDVKDFDK